MKVLNKHKDLIPKGSVYIGRPTKWGNPFVIGKDGNRIEVINKYREWVMSQENIIKDARRELRGKNLVCFCSPKPCHGDVLLEIANKEEDFLKDFEEWVLSNTDVAEEDPKKRGKK